MPGRGGFATSSKLLSKKWQEKKHNAHVQKVSICGRELLFCMPFHKVEMTHTCTQRKLVRTCTQS